MTENTPLAKAHAAAQELLTRTQDATRQFIETVSESTEKLSNDVSLGARGAADQVSEARGRVAGDLRSKAEPTADQINGAVNELIAWARRNSDRLIADLDEFRSGIEARLAPVTVVTKADLAALEARVAEAEKALAKSAKASSSATRTKTTAKKTPAKSTAKKESSKKASPKGSASSGTNKA